MSKQPPEQPLSTPERAGLEALLSRLEKDWNSEPAHEALLNYANEQGFLPDVARFYRDNLENAARRTLSEAKLSAIQVLALSQLERTRSQPTAPNQLKKALSLLLIAIFLGCVLTLFRLLLF